MAKMAMLRTCAVVLCIAAAAAMPGTGFEPALGITQLGPQPSASANSAIRAGSHQLTIDNCQLSVVSCQLLRLFHSARGVKARGGPARKKAAPSMILCSPERSRGADCGSACRRQVADFPSAGSVFRAKSRSSELACRRQIPARLPGEAGTGSTAPSTARGEQGRTVPSPPACSASAPPVKTRPNGNASDTRNQT